MKALNRSLYSHINARENQTSCRLVLHRLFCVIVIETVTIKEIFPRFYVNEIYIYRHGRHEG